MIRKITPQDQAQFISLLDEFYHSPAVLHPIPSENYKKTFDEVIMGSPYADAYIFSVEDEVAGYALLSFTYSNEAGGLVMWLEELYIRPAFQGKGLGSEFFCYIHEHYDSKVARIRLEVEADNSGALNLYKRLGYEPLPYVQMYREKEI